MCRGVAGNIPGRRLARRAGRIHVGGRLRGSRTRAGGGGLVDRRDSTDVMASAGRSAPYRTPQRASPRSICEALSRRRHHLCERAVRLRALRGLSRPVTGQRNRVAMYVRLRDCRSRRELSGDVRVASGVQRTAVQRRRARRSCGSVPQPDCIHTRVLTRSALCEFALLLTASFS